MKVPNTTYLIDDDQRPVSFAREGQAVDHGRPVAGVDRAGLPPRLIPDRLWPEGILFVPHAGTDREERTYSA